MPTQSSDCVAGSAPIESHREITMKQTLSANIRLRRDAFRHAGLMEQRPINGADIKRPGDVARFTGRSRSSLTRKSQ